MADKKTERRGLGRGLSALMADVAPVEPDQPQTIRDASAERSIPVEQISPNPDQPRRQFDKELLDDLAASIRQSGIIQPLILRTVTGQPNSYQIVAGERRWRAAQIAQLHEVPAIVRDYSDTEVLEIAIVENIQRADLNPVEEAAGYRQLMDRFGHTQEKIAEALGKSRSHIANSLRLLTLPELVQSYLQDGKLTAGHARALVTAENPANLARKIIDRGLSVRETEKLAKSDGAEKPKKTVQPTQKDADTVALEKDLSAATGMKIELDHKPGHETGSMTIRYKTLEDLDRLCNLLSSS